MENQIQIFVIVSSIFLGIFFLVTVYLIIKLKLNDMLLKRSEKKLKNFNVDLQKKVEEKTEELLQSQKKFKALYELNKEVLENSPAGIIKLNARDIIDYVNPEIEKILEYRNSKSKELLFQNINEVKEFRQMKIKGFLEKIKAEKKITNETSFMPDSQTQKFVEIKGVPLYEDNKQAGAVILINDITQSIIAEEKLKNSFQLLQNSTEDIILAMSSTSEMRDPYTAGHQKRVAELALAIAEKMSIPDRQKEGVRFASIIHDIGKISVPSDILSKPGKITNMEYEIVKNHCKIGFDLLDKIKFPWPISQIVLQHHERIDGEGYPNGLKNGDILLEARIISVADVVEAMTSHRPYRAALGIEKALDEISKFKNVKYDINVVDACIELFANKEFAFSS